MAGTIGACEIGAATPSRRLLWDGDALVAEYQTTTGTPLAARFVHGTAAGVDDPLVWYGGGENRRLHADHQGSIVAVTNGAGTATWINGYDEWGIPNATGNTGRFQYTGQIWIAELGMYHYKARIYSPTLGRFLQTDPIGYEDQMNLYAYAGNDPVNLMDPTGMSKTCNDQGLCTITADSFDASRSNGGTITLNDAQAEQAVADRGNFRTNGQDETIGFGFGTEPGATRTQVADDAETSRGGRIFDPSTRQWITTADTGRASVPAGATWAQHAHIEGSGMVDSNNVGGGFGDSQPLTAAGGRIPNVVVSDGRVGVRELVGGQLQHRMLHGSLTRAEERAIQANINSQQRLFSRR